MALIDVSELMGDTDFMDPINIIHRTLNVDAYGKNTPIEQGVGTFGSVQPASGKTLMRLPEALRIPDLMSFWVKGKIVSDGNSKYPDILVFKGERFQVQVTFPWTNWGEGFTEGTCVRERPS